jgi:hypothetical protein
MAGGPDRVLDERGWGEWIADVERPAIRRSPAAQCD